MNHPDHVVVERRVVTDLTDRQQEVLSLVYQYYGVAHEMPSSAWVSRRLSISRRRAWEHIDALRRKGWCTTQDRGL